MWVSNNIIALELRQIQPISSYLDLTKCNLDENTNAAWVHVLFNCVAQKVKSVHLLDGSTPDAGLDYQERVIALTIPVPDHRDKWFIPKLSHGASGGRLAPERL